MLMGVYIHTNVYVYMFACVIHTDTINAQTYPSAVCDCVGVCMCVPPNAAVESESISPQTCFKTCSHPLAEFLSLSRCVCVCIIK
jgi:hypothetical protein